MGSKSSSSSSSSSNDYSRFNYDSSCSCGSEYNYKKKVREIKWISVHSMSTASRVGANIGRGVLDALTLGLAEIGFQGKQLCHDALEAEIYCEKCGTYFYKTLEFTEGGTYMNTGRYANTFNNVWRYSPSNMDYSDLERIYNNNAEGASQYDLVWNNCKHWAKRVYDEIKRKY